MPCSAARPSRSSSRCAPRCWTCGAGPRPRRTWPRRRRTSARSSIAQKAAQAGADLAQQSLRAHAHPARRRTRHAGGRGPRGRPRPSAAGAELRSAQFAVATARHELEAARTALKYAAAGASADPVVVRSPVAGHVLRIPRKSEGAVAAGQALIEIGDPRGLEVEVGRAVGRRRAHPPGHPRRVRALGRRGQARGRGAT